MNQISSLQRPSSASLLRGASAPAPATTPATPAAPAAPPAPASCDRVKIAAATLAGSAVCGAGSAIACATVSGIAALIGVPFVGSGAITTAIVGSAIFGGTLTALTLPKSFAPPPGTEDDFKTGRGDVTRNLPNPKRDAASMVLAEKSMWDGLAQARSAGSSREAAEAAAAGSARITELLVHGGVRTSSLIIGGALGLASAHPLLGLPAGVLLGFGASYILDKPAHWLGQAMGHATGAIAGRIAHATRPANP